MILVTGPRRTRASKLTDLTGKRTWNGSGRIGNAELGGAAAVELDGVSCSSVGGPALSAWGLGLLGAMGLIRRRARH
ncbi:hypothetical protein ACN28S_08015 [Cystobacter fuscus]